MGELQLARERANGNSDTRSVIYLCQPIQQKYRPDTTAGLSLGLETLNYLPTTTTTTAGRHINLSSRSSLRDPIPVGANTSGIIKLKPTIKVDKHG